MSPNLSVHGFSLDGQSLFERFDMCVVMIVMLPIVTFRTHRQLALQTIRNHVVMFWVGNASNPMCMPRLLAGAAAAAVAAAAVALLVSFLRRLFDHVHNGESLQCNAANVVSNEIRRAGRGRGKEMHVGQATAITHRADLPDVLRERLLAAHRTLSTESCDRLIFDHHLASAVEAMRVPTGQSPVRQERFSRGKGNVLESSTQKWGQAMQ